ncbi:MAG: response regulator transcription factor [Bacteroidales bacterium]|nr:response regulator transcription factor [Bacteroidales bacterium]
METPRILLVEDDMSLGNTLKMFLTIKGFEVFLAKDGSEGLELFKKNPKLNLVILDVMLPKKDGFEVAREMKRLIPDIPIVFLTAKWMEEDILEGFRAGADDYITKPFSNQVLLARINAILQRTKKTEEIQTSFQIGDILFDARLQTLTYGTQVIHLTSKEADILKILFQNVDQVVPRTKLLLEIWKNDEYYASRNLDVYITKLRKKLSVDSKIKLINIHGEGYKLIVA